MKLFWILLMGTALNEPKFNSTQAFYRYQPDSYSKITDTKWCIFQSSESLVSFIRENGITGGVRIFSANEAGLTVETNVSIQPK